jgi:integrase
MVRVRKARPAERVFLTHAEVVALAAAAGDHGAFIRLLAYTGLRFGEATALRVRDVDLGRRRVQWLGRSQTLAVVSSRTRRRLISSDRCR